MRKAIVAEALAVSPGKDIEPDGGIPDDGVSMERHAFGDLEPYLAVDDIDSTRSRKGQQRKDNRENAHGCKYGAPNARGDHLRVAMCSAAAVRVISFSTGSIELTQHLQRSHIIKGKVSGTPPTRAIGSTRITANTSVPSAVVRRPLAKPSSSSQTNAGARSTRSYTRTCGLMRTQASNNAAIRIVHRVFAHQNRAVIQ